MNSWRIFYIVALGSILFSLQAHSQQLNLISNSHFNVFQENIAFAGNYEATHLSAHYSKLWSFSGAPEQYSFTAHTPISHKKLGLGFKVQSINIGAHQEMLAKVSLAYKLHIKNGLLNFGLGAGVSQYAFIKDELNPLEDEPILLNQNLKSTMFDLDFGVLYTDDKTYFGLEINQLAQSSWALFESNTSAQKLHYKFTAARVFPVSSFDFIRISAHSRSDINLNVQTDVMLNYFYSNKVWIGGGYRFNYGLLGNVEFNITRNFHLGYMYTLPVSISENSLTSGHELFIGYMIPSKETKTPSIRHF